MTLAAATLLEGPRGKDGLFTWNGLVIGNIATLPRYHIDGVTGLRDRPDAEDNRSPATGRPGEILYPSLKRARPIVIEGRVLGSDPVDLATSVSDLLTATADTEQATLTLSPMPARGGIEFITACRVQTCIISPDFDHGPNDRPTPWQHAFVLSWRTTLPTYGALPAKTNTNASTFDAVNDGGAPAELEVTVTVPSGTHDISVENTTTGRLLAFKAVPAGSFVINFTGRTCTLSGVDVGARYLDDVVSDWWDENVPALQPGSNVLLQTGGTVIAATWYDSVY